MSRVPVILNPIAGGGRLLRQTDVLRAVAADEGYELDVWKAESQAHTAELARRAADDQMSLVLAYGGDGTYNTVAKGLLGSSTAMGALPGGTTSVLAYEFGVPRPIRRSVAALLRGEDRLMRVGRTDRGDIVLTRIVHGDRQQVVAQSGQVGGGVSTPVAGKSNYQRFKFSHIMIFKNAAWFWEVI